MNQLFRMAAENLLQLYGSDGVLLLPDAHSQNVRVSPLFHASLRNGDCAASDVQANVIISGFATEPLPHSAKLQAHNRTWSILSVTTLCSGICELELKQ